jgi:hypothetical protein
MDIVLKLFGWTGCPEIITRRSKPRGGQRAVDRREREEVVSTNQIKSHSSMADILPPRLGEEEKRIKQIMKYFMSCSISK